MAHCWGQRKPARSAARHGYHSARTAHVFAWAGDTPELYNCAGPQFVQLAAWLLWLRNQGRAQASTPQPQDAHHQDDSHANRAAHTSHSTALGSMPSSPANQATPDQVSPNAQGRAAHNNPWHRYCCMLPTEAELSCLLSYGPAEQPCLQLPALQVRHCRLTGRSGTRHAPASLRQPTCKPGTKRNSAACWLTIGKPMLSPLW